MNNYYSNPRDLRIREPNATAETLSTQRQTQRRYLYFNSPPTSASSASLRLHLNPRRRGFNFIEVLFAVIILGLGFIMIAGIFPVALQQSTQTANETTAALVAREALRAIQSIADGQASSTLANEGANSSVNIGTSALFPSTLIASGNGYNNTPYGIQTSVAAFVPLTTNVLTAIGGNSYYSQDKRFGWVAFYRRVNLTDPFVQVVVIVLENPNFADPTYPLNPVFNPASPQTTVNPLPPPIPSNLDGTQSGPTFPPQGFYFPNDGSNPPHVDESPPQTTSPIMAQFAYSPSTGNSYIFLNDQQVSQGDPVPNAVTGAFVLVAADPGSPGNRAINIPDRPGPNDSTANAGYDPNAAFDSGEMTGKIYRLGPSIPSPYSQLPQDVAAPLATTSSNNIPWDCFQLQPGWELTPPVISPIAPQITSMEQTVKNNSAGLQAQNLPVYIIGAAPYWNGNYNPAQQATYGLYTGPNQDIAAISSVIRINTAN